LTQRDLQRPAIFQEAASLEKFEMREAQDLGAARSKLSAENELLF